MIEIISLKLYWQKEQNNINDKEQKRHNLWIDQIFDKDSGLCAKAPKGTFTLYHYQVLIEYGDFLFVSFKNEKKLDAFAVCVDHPAANFFLWENKNFAKPQGFFELALLCSKVSGEGADLIDSIKIFAEKTLNRTKLQIKVLPNSEASLTTYYKKQGFVPDGKKKFYMKFVF